MKLLFENWREFLKEENEIVKTNNAVVIFSDWAKGHIEKGHKEPGKGSIFADFDLSLVNSALEQIEINPNKAVYTISVPSVGYNLVLPDNEASQLEGAQKTEVEKEERQGPITVNAYTTSQPLESFKTDELSVVIRPTSELQYVPEDLQQDPAVTQALDQGNLYSVLSAWPGRGDVPPASQWGDDWAVIIPDRAIESDGEVVDETPI
tara:strand:- start:16056 stop:16676 length:621 start_codon:yes stop_codon:yes gene_type:complete